MAWVRLNSGNGPVVEIKKNGEIKFNDEAYILMNRPSMISLFYDSVTNQLGFRHKHATDEEALSEFLLFESKADEHKLKAKSHLEGGSILPDGDLELTLNAPPTVEPEEIDHGMYYVELP